MNFIVFIFPFLFLSSCSVYYMFQGVLVMREEPVLGIITIGLCVLALIIGILTFFSCIV